MSTQVHAEKNFYTYNSFYYYAQNIDDGGMYRNDRQQFVFGLT